MTRQVRRSVCHDYGMGRLLAALAVTVGMSVIHVQAASAQVFRPRGKVVSVKPNTTKASPVSALNTTTVASLEAAQRAEALAAATPAATPAAKAKRVAAAPAKHVASKPHKRATKGKHGGDDDVVVVDDDDDDVKIDDE